MPIRSYSDTQRLLYDHLNGLKERLAALEGDKEVLLKEIEQAERAFKAITTRRTQTAYNKDSTFRQKVWFCLHSRNRILSINDMVKILTTLDDDLRKDKLNTAKSIRVQVRRMLKEGVIKEYRPENMKNIHYALIDWVNDKGEIVNDYLQ